MKKYHGTWKTDYVIGIAFGIVIGISFMLGISGSDGQLSLQELEKSCLDNGGKTYPVNCQDGASHWWCNTCGTVCYWGDFQMNSPDHHEILILKNPCQVV